MDKFAKLFEDETGKQVLVMRQNNDHGSPEVRVFFRPAGLGVCSVAATFDDSVAGEDKADECFERADRAWALGVVETVNYGFCLAEDSAR